MAEGFVGMVRMTTRKQLLQGVKVGERDILVNMLQFVDDTLFLSQANTQNIMIIKSFLKCFELGLGLKVDFSKTKLGGVRIEVNMVLRYVEILNCKIMNLPFTYFGMRI